MSNVYASDLTHELSLAICGRVGQLEVVEEWGKFHWLVCQSLYVWLPSGITLDTYTAHTLL